MFYMWLTFGLIGLWSAFMIVCMVRSWKKESKMLREAVRKEEDWQDYKRKYLRQCPWCEGTALDFKTEEWEGHFFLPYAARWEQTQSIWLGY